MSRIAAPSGLPSASSCRRASGASSVARLPASAIRASPSAFSAGEILPGDGVVDHVGHARTRAFPDAPQPVDGVGLFHLQAAFGRHFKGRCRRSRRSCWSARYRIKPQPVVLRGGVERVQVAAGALDDLDCGLWWRGTFPARGELDGRGPAPVEVFQLVAVAIPLKVEARAGADFESISGLPVSAAMVRKPGAGRRSGALRWSAGPT